MPVWDFSPPAFATSGPCDESPCSFFTLFQGLGSRWKQNLVVVLSYLLVTVSQADIRWWEKNNLPLPESCTLGDPYTNKSVFPIPTNRSALDPASATVDFLIPSLVSFMCILNHLQAGLSFLPSSFPSFLSTAGSQCTLQHVGSCHIFVLHLPLILALVKVKSESRSSGLCATLEGKQGGRVRQLGPGKTCQVFIPLNLYVYKFRCIYPLCPIQFQVPCHHMRCVLCIESLIQP